MTLSRNPNIKTRVLPDGHVVLFDPGSTWAHVVNPIGALVWEFCDGRHNLPELTAEIGTLIPAEAVLAINDNKAGNVNSLTEQVESFVKELQSMGLVLDSRVQS